MTRLKNVNVKGTKRNIKNNVNRHKNFVYPSIRITNLNVQLEVV